MLEEKKLERNYNLREDQKEELFDFLKSKFPEAIEDGAINFGTLQEVLSEHAIDDEDAEHFGLNWVGKRDARRMAMKPPQGTLKPCPGEGVNEDTTENIFIEGENLEVLKILRQSYKRKVKMIYIDPPYNTGNDFIYKDNFAEPLDDYLRKTGEKSEEGLLSSNPKASGRFHTNWLNFMYPRLRIARDLLKEDGVIFISIDQNEITNLRQLMNEIFGEENLIGQVTVVNNFKGRSDDKYIATAHEYMLIYQRGLFKTFGVSIPDNYISEYDLDDDDGKGKYRIQGLRKRGSSSKREDRPNMYYPFYFNKKTESISLSKINDDDLEIYPKLSDGEDGRWRWMKDTAKKKLELLVPKFIKKREEYDIYQKDYLYENGEMKSVKPKSFWMGKKFSSDSGTISFKEIIGKKFAFENPKPIHLIKTCLEQAVRNDDIVLDFFSGTGTLGQSVFEFNEEKKQQVQFICVQVPAKVEKKHKAYKAGYRVITDVTKERILKASKLVKKSSKDRGFKVYQLTNSNFQKWQPVDQMLSDLNGQMKIFNEKPLLEGWKPEDVVTEIMLNEGFPLNSKMKQKGKTYYITSEEIPYELYINLEEKLDKKVVAELGIKANDTFICFDKALTDTVKLQLDDSVNLKTI